MIRVQLRKKKRRRFVLNATIVAAIITAVATVTAAVIGVIPEYIASPGLPETPAVTAVQDSSNIADLSETAHDEWHSGDGQEALSSGEHEERVEIDPGVVPVEVVPVEVIVRFVEHMSGATLTIDDKSPRIIKTLYNAYVVQLEPGSEERRFKLMKEGENDCLETVVIFQDNQTVTPCS